MTQAKENGIDLTQFVKQLLFKARNELTKNISGEKSLYPYPFLFRFVKEFLEASDKIKTSLINSLPIEMAILNVVVVNAEDTNVTIRKVEKSSVVKQVIPQKNEKTEKIVKNEVRVVEDKEASKTVGTDDEVEENEAKQTKQRVIDEEKSDSNLSFDIISQSWEKLLTKAKESNPHLAALLVKVVLKGFEKGRLYVEVPFKFHQKQLENTKINRTFQDLAILIMGEALMLDIAVNDLLIESKNEEIVETSNISMVEEVFGDLV